MIEFPCNPLLIVCVYCGQPQDEPCLAKPGELAERGPPHPTRIQMAAETQCPRVTVHVRRIEAGKMTLDWHPYSLLAVNYDTRMCRVVPHWDRRQTQGMPVVEVRMDLVRGVDAVSVLGTIGQKAKKGGGPYVTQAETDF